MISTAKHSYKKSFVFVDVSFNEINLFWTFLQRFAIV